MLDVTVAKSFMLFVLKKHVNIPQELPCLFNVQGTVNEQFLIVIIFSIIILHQGSMRFIYDDKRLYDFVLFLN